MNNILLLGDITGRSRVALRMLCAVLEARGHEVLMLPTALISNTLNLGMHEALDTTQYLLDSLHTWEKLGMRYDLAYIGYITGMEQAKALVPVLDKLRALGVPVVLDPILGDSGRKYHSVTQEQAEGMTLLGRHADIITPNLTEAALLLEKPYDIEQSEEYAMELSRAFGCSTLITSAAAKGYAHAMVGCDVKSGDVFAIGYTPVPGHHWGTGDLFTALMIDALLAGKTLESAAREAGEHVAAQLAGEEKSLLPRQ